ncbi:agmatinase [Caldicoprobacter algeriensis]|uniref:agmatinase n=1 Tax=Caldicoprobacter algeriensis TaxID=699281 RepID=UPI00207AE312|nr:agmatinase [Caldicoprobacter algeriensis]MCM8900859.1 agmatinase [Caldicoprobacter algeriensis]
MLKEYRWSNRFMGSRECYDESDVIMVGAPMDYSVSYRPGARFAPQKIREVSYAIEEYSPYMDRDLSEVRFFDAGDLELPMGNIVSSLEIIQQAASEILEDGKKPIFLGGDHLITYPVVKEVYEKYGDQLRLLHFDAHADLREEYLGERNSHASVIRLCSQFLPSKNIFQFGIRSGTREEFKWAGENLNFYPFEVLQPLKEVIDVLKPYPVYITLDIDVVDPAYAWGTGTPEPGGCMPHEIFQAFRAMKGLNIVGMDLVEVNPVYDTADVTSILAAKIIREAILII